MCAPRTRLCPKSRKRTQNLAECVSDRLGQLKYLFFFFFFATLAKRPGRWDRRGARPPKANGVPAATAEGEPRNANTHIHGATECRILGAGGSRGVLRSARVSLSIFFFGCLTVLLNSAKSTHTENRTFVYRCSCFIGFITYCFLILKFYVQFCSLVSQ